MILMSAVCTYDIFENNLGNKHRFAKYLLESYGLGSGQYFSFKWLPNKGPATSLSEK